METYIFTELYHIAWSESNTNILQLIKTLFIASSNNKHHYNFCKIPYFCSFNINNAKSSYVEKVSTIRCKGTFKRFWGRSCWECSYISTQIDDRGTRVLLEYPCHICTVVCSFPFGAVKHIRITHGINIPESRVHPHVDPEHIYVHSESKDHDIIYYVCPSCCTYQFEPDRYNFLVFARHARAAHNVNHLPR